MYLNLYTKVYEWTNLLAAFRKAAKGKRGKEPAARFEYHLEDNLVEIQNQLKNKTYTPGTYSSFHIHEPKRRLISAAPFKDRVVHHALINIIGSIFERSFIYDSYANRINKGNHRAIERAQLFSRRYRYVLSCDVRQFFPSIDHAILKRIIAAKVKDTGILWLVSRILHGGVNVLKNEYDMVWFEDDDASAADRPRGLPIGNLTSQFWANCYLNGLDHFIKRELRCGGYVRYVDDMLLFGDDKKTLWTWKKLLVDRLARLRLTLHYTRAQAHPVTEGIPFLGFRIFPHKKRLKRRNGINYARRLRTLAAGCNNGRLPLSRVTASVRGWAAHAAHGDTTGLRRAVLGSVVLYPHSENLYGNDTAVHQNI